MTLGRVRDVFRLIAYPERRRADDRERLLGHLHPNLPETDIVVEDVENGWSTVGIKVRTGGLTFLRQHFQDLDVSYNVDTPIEPAHQGGIVHAVHVGGRIVGIQAGEWDQEYQRSGVYVIEYVGG